ncbi:MAG: hypothetical protein IKG23_04235 [Clostridia bacterium]|nr:hypothetical protein [Clostridia bacterium]
MMRKNLIRKLCDRVAQTPWFVFAFRFCALTGLLTAVVFCVCLAGPGWDFRTAPGLLTEGSLPAERLLGALFWSFTVAGVILGLCCRNLRKMTLYCLGATAVLTLAAAMFLPQPWAVRILLAGLAVPGCLAVLIRRWRDPALAVWRKTQPEWADERAPLSASELRHVWRSSEFRREKKDAGLTPRVAFLVIMLLILTLYMDARRKVNSSGSADLDFLGIGLLLYLACMYALALLDAPVPPSLATARFLIADAVLIVVLEADHFLRSPSLAEALQTMSLSYQMESSRLQEHALAGAVFLFCLLGSLLALIRRETRKTAKLAFALYPSVAWIAVSSIRLSGSGATPLTLLAGDLFALAPALFSGILALGLEPAYGGKIRCEWLRAWELKNQRIRNKDLSAQTRTNTVSAAKSPAAPKSSSASPVKPLNPVSAPPVKPASPGASSPPNSIQPILTKERHMQIRQQILSKAKADYELIKATQEQEMALQTAKTAASVLLSESAARLYPGGEALASLQGQRQLLIWLTEGVSCLRKLRKHPAVQALMDPVLPEDPASFLPVLNRVVLEAETMLEKQIWEDDRNWKDMSAETLVGGWFALNMYARMSSRPEIFQLAADGISDYFSGNAESLDALRSLSRGE